MSHVAVNANELEALLDHAGNAYFGSVNAC